MSVLWCCPQIFSFCLNFLNLPPYLNFLSKLKGFHSGRAFYIFFYDCFSFLPWVISFALYFLNLPPNFSVHMKSEDFIYCCLQSFCVIPLYLLVLFYFFFLCFFNLHFFSLFDFHFLVFLSVVVILFWFVSLCWLFTFSFHSCFSLLPLFCLVFPLTSFIFLYIRDLIEG